MHATTPGPFEAILGLCARAAPHPWYPSDYAQANGIPRDSLDPYLEQLRLGGLIRLTDWVGGRGQGYVLTPEGDRVLRSPRELERLRHGQLPARASANHYLEGGSPRFAAGDRRAEIRDALVNPFNPVVSIGLFALNVLVFLAGCALATARHVPLDQFLLGFGREAAWREAVWEIQHDTGAITTDDILNHQWWRLLTACFVHIGFIHLAFNMYGLYAIGPLSERLWGHARYLALYLISGLVGSAAMMLTNVPASGAGASGALFGLMTGLLVWVLLNRRHLPRSLASRWLTQLVVLLVLNVVITQLVPNISGAAHYGGATAGAVLAVLLYANRHGRLWLRWLALAGALAVPAVCLAAVVLAPQYDNQWSRYVQAEEDRERRQRQEQEAHERWQRQERARKDIKDIDSLLPKLSELERAALKEVEQSKAEDLVSRAASERKEDAVRKALAGLEQVKPQLEEAVALLKKAGPYEGEVAERARRTRLEHFETRIRLFDTYKKCLEAGDEWTAEDQKALKQQWEKMTDVDNRWKALLQ